MSNSVCVVGHRIRLEDCGREATIIAFDHSKCSHTIKFENDGEERKVALKKLQFSWLVEKSHPSPTTDAKGLLDLALHKDAVGRKIEVYSKNRDRYDEGIIIDFLEPTMKHKVLFQRGRQTRLLNLTKHQWHFTDFVNGKNPKKEAHTFLTSRFLGVERSSFNTWRAYLRVVEDGKKRQLTVHFGTEKDAALAYDVFARKRGRLVNFPNERITEKEVWERKIENSKIPAVSTKEGTAKYRGVHWQKNRHRWMARYSIPTKGVKNINLGAFIDAKQAALAFDAEARRRGRPDSHLNFPDEHPTDAEIDSWKMNKAHYTMMASGRKLTSQYRGVCAKGLDFCVQINYKKILQAYKLEKGPMFVGTHPSEKGAALLYDRICRNHGIPEKELNFPRDFALSEVRLFDNECYSCRREMPKDPVATPCNHVFCSNCVREWGESDIKCPCCGTFIPSKQGLIPISLVGGRIELPNLGRKRSSRGGKRAMTTMPSEHKIQSEPEASPPRKKRKSAKAGNIHSDSHSG